MKQFHMFGLSAVALALALVDPARGQFERDGLSAFDQTAAANLIVIGKVTDIEPQPVLAVARKGGEKVAHLVATIRVEEGLLGAKGLTHVRVGFVPEVQKQVIPKQFQGFV